MVVDLRRLLIKKKVFVTICFQLPLRMVSMKHILQKNFLIVLQQEPFLFIWGHLILAITLEETLIKTIRSKLKQMEILFEQYLQREIRVSTIYLYGNHIADGFLQTLEKSLSVISLRLNPLQNVDKTEGMEKNLPALEEVTKYVESIGVVLDQ